MWVSIDQDYQAMFCDLLQNMNLLVFSSTLIYQILKILLYTVKKIGYLVALYF